MRQHSIARVDLSWFELDLKKGAAAGSFIQEALSSPRHWNLKANGVGGASRHFIPDRSGFLTISIDAESELHQLLYTLLETDALLGNVVGPGMMKDSMSGEETVYVDMFLAGEPNEQKGQEGAVYQWEFGFVKKQKIPGTGTANVIGSGG